MRARIEHLLDNIHVEFCACYNAIHNFIANYLPMVRNPYVYLKVVCDACPQEMRAQGRVEVLNFPRYHSKIEYYILEYLQSISILCWHSRIFGYTVFLSQQLHNISAFFGIRVLSNI